MKTKLGTQLHPDDKAHVLRAYIHRFTGDHRPSWVMQRAHPINTPFEVQFADDHDWLAHSEFTVKKNGRLDHRVKFCFSCPTWPMRQK